MDTNDKKPERMTQPTPDNDKTWPIGMLPGGNKLNEVEMDGDYAEPTAENE